MCSFFNLLPWLVYNRVRNFDFQEEAIVNSFRRGPKIIIGEVSRKVLLGFMSEQDPVLAMLEWTARRTVLTEADIDLFCPL